MQINIPTSASWRTSLGGVAALLASLSSAAHLVHQGNYNFAQPEWTATLGGLASAIALLFARDHVVSSEEAGLKGTQLANPTVIVDALKETK